MDPRRPTGKSPTGKSPTSNPSHKRLSKETGIAAFTALGIGAYLIATYLIRIPVEQTRWILFAVLALGGLPLIVDLLRVLVSGRPGADLIAGISIVSAAALGEYLAGSIVVLMLSGGTALEQYATRRASSVLEALAKRMPRVAHRRVDDHIQDVGLDDLRIGDVVVVLPHEACPVDGTVTEGHGSMDESYLTGEPYRISKVVGAQVLSGAVNGEAVLTIRVGALPVDSRYAKIVRVMQEAEERRPRFRRIADRLGAWYSLFALVFALAGWWAGGDPKRFLAVLVIATPCPLLLAIPVAIIGAISIAASRGIIVKNPGMLERIDACRTVIFDKTGTLTYGRPDLVETLCAPHIEVQDAIRIAASLEQYSKHPLAAPILAAAERMKIKLAGVAEIGERPGEGLRGTIDQAQVEITGRGKLSAEAAQNLPPVAAGMECILLVNGQYAACFRFRDTPRVDSRSFIRHLGPRHQMNRLMLLSGDRRAEVEHLAGEVGIAEALYGKSPEEKVAIVTEEVRKAPTLFVGDGINDAPAMQAATVGVAFGQNSDVTAEAADAVVLEASLAKIDELIHIGRRMRAIALQSAIGGMALSVAGMGLAAAGYLPPVAGAIAQEVIDVLAVLNAVRVAIPGADLRDDIAEPVSAAPLNAEST